MSALLRHGMLRRISPILVVGVVFLSIISPALALIIGGAGNQPLDDPGWPAGSAAVFNDRSRIAWWEGPPLGGGQWNAEYRGETAALQRVLDGFAQIDVPERQVVLHDGTSTSFWLSTQDRSREHPVDWKFMVWVPERFPIQRGLSVSENAVMPPPRLDVYLGGHLDWSAIRVPEGITLLDHRLEAHGFSLADGVVFQGHVTWTETAQAIEGAEARLELVEPQETGGYVYSVVRSVSTDGNGLWTMTAVPEGWYRIVISAPGGLDRIIGHHRVNSQPGWHRFDSTLSSLQELRGVVFDEQGQPLAGASIRIFSLIDACGEGYASLDGEVVSDQMGEFRMPAAQGGQVKLSAHSAGYVHLGLPETHQVGDEPISITLHRAGEVLVVVNFSNIQQAVLPGSYLVCIEPEEGLMIGSWGGSAQVSIDGSVRFTNVPPGHYVIHGRPNPGSDNQQTASRTIEVLAGETTEATLDAR